MVAIPTTYPTHVLLSGGDCFFLAMERHYSMYGNAGNVCHLHISFEGVITAVELEKKINSLPIFSWLSKIELKRGGLIGIPHWKYNSIKNTPITIDELHVSETGLPKQIIEMTMSLKDQLLFRFTLLHQSNGYSSLVFSWHHIVMDAKGAETLMKFLGGEIEEKDIHYFPPYEKRMNKIKAFIKLHFSKEFVKKSAKKPLVQLVKKKPSYIPTSAYKVLELSVEQTALLDQRALQHGAKVSKGSFFLAATTKAVNEWLLSKGNTEGSFWIPVPQNRRARGGYGPVISNLQSFMFYRIGRDKLISLRSCTEYLTSQMFDLIRHKRPDDYAIMSNMLRRMPSWFYYWLIKGPAGGSVASFLYSDPGVNTFHSFMGMKVTDITNYPPSTFPPGLMTIFERFNGKQKIIINHTLQVVSSEDLAILESNLLRELLGENDEKYNTNV